MIYYLFSFLALRKLFLCGIETRQNFLAFVAHSYIYALIQVKKKQGLNK